MTGSTPSTLGSAISITKGKKHEVSASPSSKAVRLIGIDDLRNDDSIRYTDDPVGVEAVPEDILIAWDGANAGTIGFSKSGYIGSTIARLRVRHGAQLFTPFIGAYLKSKFEYLRQTSTGATIPHINRNALESIPLPAVTYNDQIRIAHLLSKVEGLIARRKQQLAQLDAMLKGVFLEMFGDPVRNEKGWDKAPLEQFGSINRGISKHRPRNDPQLLGGRHPLIQTGEVSNAGTYITAYTQTYSDIGFAQSKPWPAGTLCITIAANIAQTGILTFDACFPDSVVGFTADKAQSNTLYVLGLFWFFQAILEKNAPAAAQKNINLEILRRLEVPKPPVELQNKFADAVEKIEALKSRYQQTLTDLETLYAALSQSAFKGELDLSRIPLPTVTISGHTVETNTSVTGSVRVTAFAFPDLGLPASTLADEAPRLQLLTTWLGVWQAHFGAQPFVLQDFLNAAEARLAELYPEDDLELGMAAYEQIKTWVFAALDAGQLVQELEPASKRIALKHAHA